MREGQVLPHLAALAILLSGQAGAPGRGSRGLAQLTGPAETADPIDQLRATGTVLTYDPDARTPGRPDPARRRPLRALGHHRQEPLTREREKREKGEKGEQP